MRNLSVDEMAAIEAVEVEIRAAELAVAAVEAWDGDCPGICTTREKWGWEDHETGDEEPDGEYMNTPEWAAGWLAREIAETTWKDKVRKGKVADPVGMDWQVADASVEVVERIHLDDNREVDYHSVEVVGEKMSLVREREVVAVPVANATAALVADLDAQGPAYGAINDAFAEMDAEMERHDQEPDWHDHSGEG